MGVWDEFADAPTHDKEAAPPADPWAEFKDAPKSRINGTLSPRGRATTPALTDDRPTGEAHDGDTFRMRSGVNARLYGADAFELSQIGRDRQGKPVALGLKSRDWLRDNVTPESRVALTGGMSYGRPVAALSTEGRDVAGGEIGQGLALAAPEYLRADPARLHDYMEAERLARLNYRGAHDAQFQSPTDFRRGKPDPWAKPQPGKEGDSAAVFWDEPTPFQGLRPDIEKGYLAILDDPNAKASDAVAFAKANGFEIDPATVSDFFEKRAKGVMRSGGMEYGVRPRVLTDLGDGTFGATMRGVADPINMLDEASGLADSLVPNALRAEGQERVNVWDNQDRRFGDILANNTEQARQIIGHDEAQHGWARFGGQVGGSLLVPAASIEGVGLRAGTRALRSGATRFTAEQVAKDAVAGRMATIGSVEGGLAGAGGGENVGDRVTGAAIGAPIGGTLGLGGGLAIPVVGRFTRKVYGELRGGADSPNVEGLGGDAADIAKMGAQNDLSQDMGVETGERLVDRLDLGQPRRPAAIAPSHGQGGATAPTPTPPLPPARTVEELRPEIAAFAEQHGARPATGDELPEVMLHGSPNSGIDTFDPYGRSGYGLFGTGTYLTDASDIAASYTKKGLKAAQAKGEADQTVYAVRHTVKNPIDMDAPANIAEWERVAGDRADFHEGMTNEQAFRAVEQGIEDEGSVPKWEGAEEMDGVIRALGHDGITHVGGGRVGSGKRHRVLIALDPEQTQIIGSMSLKSALSPAGPRARDVLNVANREGGSPIYSPAELRAASKAEHGGETLDGPEAWAEFADAPGHLREPDRIDINAGRPRPLLDDTSEAARIAQGERLNPDDVLPLPNSAVRSMEEAEGIGAGMRPEVKAPKEAAELSSRSIPSPVDGAKTIAKKGPLDLVTWLRAQGGIKAQGGELEHYGIDNTPRAGMDFAGGEGRFGKLVSNNGMGYDEAARRAWEAGYFPDHAERPTVSEFLDTLNATHTGRNRSFLPGDRAEVDAFEAARAQRQAVEGAREHGAPLVSDKGQPIDLADLERNTPPVHAYEDWGDQAPDFAGNLRLDKLDSPQSIARALSVTEQRVGGFDAATRGKITQAETESLASELGMTQADLLARRKGQAFNAEQALAARQILAKSGNELVNMAKRVAALDNPGDEVLAAFRQAWTRHVAIQEQVSGATAEAGRALAQFRIMADSRAVKSDVLKSLTEGIYGPDRLKKAAEMIVDNAGDPGTMNPAAARALKPKFRDKLVELYYNSILSGPQTHAVNIMSNTMTALGQLPEHAGAALLGAPRAMLKSGDDRVLFSELGARTIGLLQGTREGLRQAARTFRTGDSSDLMAKVESQETKAISGVKGSLIRTPTRALSAEDELFKAMARRMELAGLAVRAAKAEGLKGSAAKQRAADLVANPSDDMLAKAFDYGRYLTFQRPLGPLGQSISRITQTHLVLKLVLPFVRTPTNILKFSAERSPLAPMLKSWRADFVAGGARRDLAVAKVLIGSGVMASTMQMVGEGRITGGGPADDSAKAIQRADGWQPYSLRIGDKYYSYQRLDPFASTLGVAADFADLQTHMTDKQKDDVAGLLVASTLKNLSNKTWLSGVSDLTEAVNEPERFGASYLRNRAASIAVPALVAQAARTMDPTLREAKTILDAVRARVPGLSDGLMPRLDVWGRPVQNEGGLGPNIVSPVWQSTAKRDPINAAVLAAGAHIGQPSRKVGGRELTPQEYFDYQVNAGALSHSRIGELVQSREWKSVEPEARADLIEDTLRKARAEIRRAMFTSASKLPAGNGHTNKDAWAEFRDAR